MPNFGLKWANLGLKQANMRLKRAKFMLSRFRVVMAEYTDFFHKNVLSFSEPQRSYFFPILSLKMFLACSYFFQLSAS